MLQTSHVLPHCSRHTFADLTIESTESVFCCPKTGEGTLFCATSLECLRHFIQHLWKYVWETFVHATLKFNKWNMPWTRSTVLPLSQNVSVAMPAVISVGKPSGQRRTSNVVQALKKKSLPKTTQAKNSEIGYDWIAYWKRLVHQCLMFIVKKNIINQTSLFCFLSWISQNTTLQKQWDYPSCDINFWHETLHPND